LPDVEAFQHGILSLGAKGNSHTVPASGADPHGEVLPAVGEDLHDAAVDKHLQLQRLASSFQNRSLGRSGSPIQNSKTDLNGIHKPYTIKLSLFFKDLFDDAVKSLVRP